MNIQEYVNIKDYSTLKIGGQFKYFIEIYNTEDIVKSISFSKEKNIPLFILGGGSNIVFSDGILNIIALKINIKGFEIIKETDDFVDIKVGSGEIWDEIVDKTVNMNLCGFEALSAIPGTVGAGPIQNIGAYGSEVKDTILEVEVFDVTNNQIISISNNNCKFGYRDSIFKNEAKGKYIITAVIYRLKKYKILSEIGPLVFKTLSYPGISKYFEEKGIDNPTPIQIREAIIDIRKDKLPNPKDTPNVGSFFKNPIVENSIALSLKIKYKDIKFFPVDDNYTKIPAGWLIENSGLKGKSFGSISVYDKNALVLVNNGDASSEEILRAKNEIIKIVEDKFGITLEQEPEVV